jgi:hypothetical protein
MRHHAWVLRQLEFAQGFYPLALDSEPWFSSEDWEDGAIVSRNGSRLRIVLITAKNPGHGAFTRMLVGMAQAGYRMEIAAPLAELEAMLIKRGWRKQRIGSGDLAQTVWRPTLKMLKAMAQGMRPQNIKPPFKRESKA